MRSLIQFSLLFLAAQRVIGQSRYQGRLPRGSMLGRGSRQQFGSVGRRGGMGSLARGGEFSIGRSRSFGTGRGQPSFESRGSFGSSGGFSPSFDRSGRGFETSFSTGRRTSGGNNFGNNFGNEPSDIRRILGSSVTGRELRMGERGLPRHGGAGAGEEHANGMMRGWDGNPQTLGNRFQNEWTDPMGGRAIPRLPSNFNGDFGSISRGRVWG